MEKNQFKLFDKVLVRDDDSQEWRIDFYSRFMDISATSYPYQCMTKYWKQCIPYNEETAHLANTNYPYEPAEPKEYHVSWHLNSKTQWVKYTAKEFENFIRTAVIHNKDISNFTVRRINN